MNGATSVFVDVESPFEQVSLHKVIILAVYTYVVYILTTSLSQFRIEVQPNLKIDACTSSFNVTFTCSMYRRYFYYKLCHVRKS